MNERRRSSPQKAVSEQWAWISRLRSAPAVALLVTRTTLSPRSKEDARGGAWMRGVDGGAMHAIYQHRTDNEVPRRLPVVEDDDGDRAADCRGRR